MQPKRAGPAGCGRVQMLVGGYRSPRWAVHSSAHYQEPAIICLMRLTGYAGCEQRFTGLRSIRRADT
jgi:hypothetical protein